MNDPRMLDARAVGVDTFALPAYLPIPGLGGLPVNAYLIRSAEPVLVDAGLPALSHDFVAALGGLIDPADLRFIWTTHVDADHVGALQRVLSLAPRAKLVTTFVGLGKLSMHGPLPPERVHLLNPGQSLELSDRQLLALTPPTYDAPETTAVFDASSGALFSSDCFGTLASQPWEHARDIPPDELREGIATWTSVDAPWLPATSEAAFDQMLARVDRLRPSAVLGSHLPPATGSPELVGTLRAHLRAARTARPFVGPDQKALESMLSAA